MAVSIIEFTPDLSQAVADMWNNSGDGWGGDLSICTAQNVITEIKANTYINVYLAEHEGEIIGYASLSKYFGDDSALYLHTLNVRPAWHGKKVGKMLVLQCVKRAIELGYPRLDIHTWPGNTKAVPLYKKCGYMWEDRVDSTHLVNFVPTVLASDACKDFFKNADWYGDSSRIIEVKPDGTRENSFEVFRYEWKKDGHMLAAGFERTGRRMRLIETDAYRLTLTAETHQPAFGFNYGCAFEIENKNGGELNVKIRGKNDRNISLDFSADENISEPGTKVIRARFNVGEITEPQDIWRVHPCVLADVWINGRHLEMGMGVETKRPIDLELTERKKVAVPGSAYDAYFNLTNNINKEAEIKISLPDEAKVTKFVPGSWTVKLPPLGRTSVKVKAVAVDCGYEAVAALCEVSLPDGSGAAFTRPLEVNTQGFTGMRGFETEKDYVVQNGLWSLSLSKNGSFCRSGHLLNGELAPGFVIGKLCLTGTPYTDEFSRRKPDEVKTYAEGDAMALEAVYRARTPEGAEYSAIVSVTANGIITRRSRVKNLNGAPMNISLSYNARFTNGIDFVIPFNGGFQKIADGLSHGTASVNHDLVDENWLFDNSPPSPFGICWAKEYKPAFRWGDDLLFEHTDILISAGGTFESKPIRMFCGVFTDSADFRDYALQTYGNEPLALTPHMEWEINGGNPFADTDTWTADFKVHRSVQLCGDITMRAGGREFKEGRLSSPPREAVTVADLHMNMDNFDKRWHRAVFVPDGTKPVSVTDEGGVLTVSNGAVSFKTDPAYSNACFSVVSSGHEWLMSSWPEHKPYSWMNPFIGGINGELEGMGNAMTVREPISASPAERPDSFGNAWKGVSSAVTVEKYDKHKGMEYTHYYLTLPSLPVICMFTEFVNRTGSYKKFKFNYDSFLGEKGNLKNIILSGTDAYGTEFRMRAGAEDWGRSADKLAAASIEGKNEKLYIYNSSEQINNIGFWSDQNVADIFTNEFYVELEDEEKKTTSPVFFILTDVALDKNMPELLKKVKF